MKNRFKFHRISVLVLLLLFAARLFAGEGLHILLTNDDGFDSAGLKILREQLEDYGHSVSVVAPLAQRSGSGMKITVGALSVQREEEKVWSVDASPADSVSFALKHLMVSTPPDLIVSGANFGQNLGSIIFSSGTVGAAMMAALLGKPAIAVSVGILLEEAHLEPERFPSTVAVFPAAAQFTAKLVEDVAELVRNGKYPLGHVLNINYPARERSDIKGAAWVPASRFPGFELVYPVDKDGGIRSWIETSKRGLSDPDSDIQKFSEGFVTLSWLMPDWNSRPSDPKKEFLKNPNKYLQAP